MDSNVRFREMLQSKTGYEAPQAERETRSSPVLVARVEV